MKKLILLLTATIAFACKKNPTNENTLTMIQHKWKLVSHNGEALRYIGKSSDYYNFAVDSNLYIYMDSVYDTMRYTLRPDNTSLNLYQIQNGKKIDTAILYNISVLNNSQFILKHTADAVLHSNILDSLSR